jgi:hypothetical protein
MQVPEGFESKSDHAKWFGKLVAGRPFSERTIDRLTDEPDGLPYTRASRWKLFCREWSLEWLANRRKQRNPTSRPGRRAA